MLDEFAFHAFNRTLEELKLPSGALSISLWGTFNRTLEELKSSFTGTVTVGMIAFNRTLEELKSGNSDRPADIELLLIAP